MKKKLISSISSHCFRIGRAFCFTLAVCAVLLKCDTSYGPTPYTVDKYTLSPEEKRLDSLQKAYINLNFGMFIHFSMSTFHKCCCNDCYSVAGEWGDAASAEVVPSLYKPENLNTGQWADAANAAGMKYMIMTSKHHDGFCNWNSQYTEHDVGSSDWGIRTGRDPLKEFADSARSRGIKVGFYYSIWDKTNGSSLPFVKGQLTELLTNYGEISSLWFDGWKWMVGYNYVPYDTIKTLIKTLQPNCLIIENNHFKSLRNTEIVEYEYPIDGPPESGNIDPAECSQSIRNEGCWFWHPNNECDIMTAPDIVSRCNSLNASSANYLLNVTPDTNGVIPQCIVDRLQEVGAIP